MPGAYRSAAGAAISGRAGPPLTPSPHRRPARGPPEGLYGPRQPWHEAPSDPQRSRERDAMRLSMIWIGLGLCGLVAGTGCAEVQKVETEGAAQAKTVGAEAKNVNMS